MSASRVPERVSASTRSTAARPPGVNRARSPSTLTRTPCDTSSPISDPMYSSSRLISAEISVAGRFQFSSEKAKSGQHFDARLDRALDHLPHRLHPRPMAQRARQVPLARPAAVAVHDDGDVARDGAMQPDLREEVVAHQTSMISASLALTASSTSFR